MDGFKRVQTNFSRLWPVSFWTMQACGEPELRPHPLRTLATLATRDVRKSFGVRRKCICKSLDEQSKCIYDFPMISWDGSKRRLNLKKHGIDLAELESAFDFPMVTVEDDRQVYGELRLQSLAMWRGRVIFLVWTEREEGAHLISCRYADRSQIEDYFAGF